MATFRVLRSMNTRASLVRVKLVFLPFCVAVAVAGPAAVTFEHRRARLIRVKLVCSPVLLLLLVTVMVTVMAVE